MLAVIIKMYKTSLELLKYFYFRLYLFLMYFKMKKGMSDIIEKNRKKMKSNIITTVWYSFKPVILTSRKRTSKNSNC